VLALTRTVRHPGNHVYGWALDRRARHFFDGKAQPFPKLEIRKAA
jgi:hypothetical protein